MKTLFFCNLIPLKTGAFETLLAAIGAEFKKAGDEFVVVFSGEPIPPVAASLQTEGVRWLILKEWADGPGKEHAWGFALPALRLLRQERPDVAVVHFGNELPTLMAILLARLTGLGKVKWVWQQDQQIQDPGRMGKHLSRLSLLSFAADQFVAVYEGGRQSMLKRGIPAEKIAVIHNSVAPYTPTRPKGWLRREWGWESSGQWAVGSEQLKADGTPNATVLLVTNGSLIPRKRIDFILRVCAQLREEKTSFNIDKQDTQDKEFSDSSCKSCQSMLNPSLMANCPLPTDVGSRTSDYGPRFHVSRLTSHVSPLPPEESKVESPKLEVPRFMVALPPWRLLVIGEGPERERLGALATELGIADRVHFLGLRNDVREILPECDIYLHASKAETCTYAVTESMAAGIPAVMLNAGAAKEQIENGVTGFVFDVVDPVPFAECLSDLMADPARRAEMGQLAKTRWAAQFRIERAAAGYHEIYARMA